MISTSNKGIKDKVADKVAKNILFVQEQFSNRMNKLKHLKVILICFCLISGSLSIYVFIDAIVSKPQTKFHIERIQAPRMIEEPSDRMYEEKIPSEIYEQIHDYRRYMDSIGEPIRQSLADSMRLLEEIYLKQQR